MVVTASFPIAVTKYPGESNLKRKGPFGSQLMGTVHQGMKSKRRELEAAAHRASTVGKQSSGCQGPAFSLLRRNLDFISLIIIVVFCGGVHTRVTRWACEDKGQLWVSSLFLLYVESGDGTQVTKSLHSHQAPFSPFYSAQVPRPGNIFPLQLSYSN